MQVVGFAMRRHLNKNIGKTIILQHNTNEEYLQDADQIFAQEKRIRCKETFYIHPRNLAMHYKGKQLRQRRKDIVRRADQKRINFFVHNVLAQKNISIPLR